MADISVINVGGSDYNVKDTTGRSNANTALAQLAYQETGNTASQAYSIIGTPINWKGTLYYTKTAVAKGATWSTSTNLTSAGNLGKLTSNIKTYVNGSGQLVFRDLTGADTVLPFNTTAQIVACTANASPNDVYTVLANHVGKQCIALTYAMATDNVSLTVNGVSITPITQLITSNQRKEYAFLFTIPSSPSASNIVMSNVSGIPFNFVVLK